MLRDFLLMQIGSGLVTALVARWKGKSTVGWFFVGLTCGIFGLLFLCVKKDR